MQLETENKGTVMWKGGVVSGGGGEAAQHDGAVIQGRQAWDSDGCQGQR